MSQSNVERVIGLLVTDEACRRRFIEDPRGTLDVLVQKRLGLTECELQALAVLDPVALVRFADAIDPRLQKTDLGVDRSSCGTAQQEVS